MEDKSWFDLILQILYQKIHTRNDIQKKKFRSFILIYKTQHRFSAEP